MFSFDFALLVTFIVLPVNLVYRYTQFRWKGLGLIQLMGGIYIVSAVVNLFLFTGLPESVLDSSRLLLIVVFLLAWGAFGVSTLVRGWADLFDIDLQLEETAEKQVASKGRGMFFGGKKKKATQAMIYWSALANFYVSEHDRTFDGVLEAEGFEADKNSENYVQGKYLYRMIATNMALVGAGMEGKVTLDESVFDAFQTVLKMLAIEGTSTLEKFFSEELDVSELDQVSVLDKDKLIDNEVKNHEDGLLRGMVQYFAGNELAIGELIPIYVACFEPLLGEKGEGDYASRALGLFQSARAGVLKQIS